MEKMKMETPDITARNIEKIAEMFPNCITEDIGEDGKPRKAINFEILRQMLSDEVIEGDEAYGFTWVGKKAAMVEANKPIRKTLRPCKEESVDWDNTENLYIEGDNLQVLKLLQQSYMGKVKMIYIDPPYNTGNDFVYRDDFKMSEEEWRSENGELSEEGDRLFKNTDSNGRFHSDWCSMIYSRLLLARNLLADDGVIFVSIDDNEQENLKKICNEVFGERNCIGPIIQNKQNAKNDTTNIQRNHEFILVYRNSVIINGTAVKPTIQRKTINYKDAFEENGEYYYLNDPITTRGEGGTLNARPNLGYTIYYKTETKDIIAVQDYNIELAKTSNNEDEIYENDNKLISLGYIPIRPPRVRGKLGCWTWALEKFNTDKKQIIITGKKGSYAVKKRTFVNASDIEMINGKLQYKFTNFTNSRSILDFSTNEGTNTLTELMNAATFNNPKNLDMLKYFVGLLQDKDSIILDFFSGSATTAHAVMQLNAEDGGNRKFIMVQIPEETDEKSEAYKAGYKNICEIGKERIRRAAKKIAEENPDAKFDGGFRVFKLDDTNMKDVYYGAGEYSQLTIDQFVSNIKEDRTDMDLLFGCLLDWGVTISQKHSMEEIDGCHVHTYGNGAITDLIACFDENIPESVIKYIAKKEPMRVVFRDSSFADSPAKINVTEIFKMLSPDTEVKVI
ncbi:MAG: site-specific DNA-methyltransferase [Firmicutes bacterium]|nr:site-specific DNA-methyltransferase [Bacillota bacterium]